MHPECPNTAISNINRLTFFTPSFFRNNKTLNEPRKEKCSYHPFLALEVMVNRADNALPGVPASERALPECAAGFS